MRAPLLIALFIAACALLSLSACERARTEAPPDAAPDGADLVVAAPPPAPIDPPPAPTTPARPIEALCAAADAACLKYAPLWPDLVVKKSGIDRAFFDAHVVPLAAASNKWNDGESVRVRYRLTIDWASFEREDVFVVFIDPSAAPYPALGVPRGVALDAAQISRAVAGEGWGSAVAALPRVGALKFKSQDDALAALRAQPNGASLADPELSFDRPGMLPRQNGDPHLHARGTHDAAANSCSSGMIDLVTGEAHVMLNACIMTGGPIGAPTGGVVR